MTAKQMVAEIHAEVPETTALAPVNGGTPITQLIQLAIQKMDGENGPAIVETLKGLYDLHERDQAKRAEASFNRAMAAFQADCPPVRKASTAKISTKSGAQFSYKYAELDEIAETIKPFTQSLGLAYSWDTEITGESIKATCTLRHIDGHSVTSSFQCPTDSKADMSGAQRHGAAVTYAKRQSLIAVLGLTTTETDTDAQRHIDRDQTKITSEQAANVSALIDETATDIEKFLAFFEVDRVADLTTAQFGKAMQMLERKRGGQ